MLRLLCISCVFFKDGRSTLILLDTKAGASLGDIDEAGCTTLHKVAIGGYADVAQFLIDEGAPLEVACAHLDDPVRLDTLTRRPISQGYERGWGARPPCSPLRCMVWSGQGGACSP